MPAKYMGASTSFNRRVSASGISMSMLGLETYEHDLCLIKQVNILTMFYLVNIFVQIFLYLLGNDAIKAKALLCARENFLIVHSEIGGLYMIFYSANILVSSLIMQIVFYHLPVKFNLVAFSKFGQTKVDVEKINTSKSLVGIEDDLDQMIQVDEEAREFD